MFPSVLLYDFGFLSYLHSCMSHLFYFSSFALCQESFMCAVASSFRYVLD